MSTLLNKRPGDRVTILVPAGIGQRGLAYRRAVGRVVMAYPDHLVLNMGGRFGRPAVATLDNIVSWT